MGSLPLFPIDTVLVPGARLPLRIFEPRYVALLKDLLQRHQAPTALVGDDFGAPASADVLADALADSVATIGRMEFGVIAVRAGHEVGNARQQDLHAVGCVARLVHLAPLEDGSFQVMVHGSRRFRLEYVVPSLDTPYLIGEVAYLSEDEANSVELTALARRVHRLLGEYRSVVGGDPMMMPESPTALSYRVVDAMVLELEDQQALLATSDTMSRLDLALLLLRRELGLLAALHAIPQRFHGLDHAPN